MSSARSHFSPVVFLHQEEAGDLAAVGGKAASLHRLMDAGFVVPRGFVIPTSVYREAMERAGLREWIPKVLTGLDPSDLAGLASRAAAIRSRILEAPFPEGLGRALRRSLSALGRGDDANPRLVVRSSATLEDLADASFAGQHDSFLDVRGERALAGAVRACWASLYSDRAVAYRLRLGLGDEEVLAAVIVQVLVPTEVAGVMLTANPLTGVADRIRIEAAWGLGEGVVSGRVDPDSYVLAPGTRRLLEHRVGAKAERAVGGREGSCFQATPEALRGVPCLDEIRLAELAEASLRAVETFGTPLDIEWGIADGRLHLFQARPITVRLPVPEDSYSSHYAWSNANFAETMPDPVSPLGWSIFKGEIEKCLLPPEGARPGPSNYRLMVEIHGRPYWDLTPLFWFRWFWPGVRDNWLRATDHRTVEACEELLEKTRFHFRWSRALRPRLWLGFLRFFLWLPGHLLGLLRVLLTPKRSMEEVGRAHREALAAAVQETPEAAPVTEHTAGIRATFQSEAAVRTRQVNIRTFFAAMISGGIMVDIARRWLGEEEPTRLGLELAAGRSGNPTLDMGLRLWELSRLALEEPGVRRLLEEVAPGVAYDRLLADHGSGAFVSALRGFLEEFGHRAPGEQDLENPRWAEQPSLLLPVIRSYLRIEDEEAGAPAKRRRSLAAFTRRVEQARETLAGSGPLARWRGALFEHMLGVSETLFPMRENFKQLSFECIYHLKKKLSRLGRVLAREGHLRRPEDVWYLEFEELLEWAEAGCPEPARMRGLVLRRRLDRARHRTLEAPLLITSDGREFFGGAEEETDGNGRTVLRGQAASSGKVTARVRVIRDPSEGHLLEPGEILVAPFTDPGWTPLFLVASGLIMEVGGTISHGVIVAREYGIPAVVGLGGATDTLEDGQEVTLDGRLGTVRIETTTEERRAA